MISFHSVPMDMYTTWTVKFVLDLVLLTLFLSIKWNSCPESGNVTGKEFHQILDKIDRLGGIYIVLNLINQFFLLIAL